MDAIILARGGSKGVPNKNIRLLNGKPLICYPIESAKKTNFIENIFVSTDSEKIASIADSNGAIVIKRPESLADDKSLDVDAFRHAVKEIGSYEPIMHLRATTPLIDPNVLDVAYSKFKESEHECTSLRSAHAFPESVYKFFKKSGKYWTGFFPELSGEYYNQPRQCFPENYLPNGYVDIVKPDIFMNKDTFHGDKILSFVTEYSIEVDCEDDFIRLEQEIRRRNELQLQHSS